jgi:hypothetical protein
MKCYRPGKKAWLHGYKAEKNCCDRFSQIILSPVSFLLQHASSIDSLQELCFEAGVEDGNTKNAATIADTVKSSRMVYFNLMLGWFPI